MRKKRWILPLVAIAAVGAITPSYVRAFRVSGTSDAPSFLEGDQIIVSKAAYDLRLPYTEIVVLAHSQPQSGDVIMYRAPGDDYPVFKRVIGCPGDTIVMRENRLEINGVPLSYEPVDESRYDSVALQNNLGSIVEMETGNGPPHLTTHTPGAGPAATFGPVHVPEEHFFVIGDNRDHSRDSRDYGPVHRRSILGKVIRSNQSIP